VGLQVKGIAAAEAALVATKVARTVEANRVDRRI